MFFFTSRHLNIFFFFYKMLFLFFVIFAMNYFQLRRQVERTYRKTNCRYFSNGMYYLCDGYDSSVTNGEEYIFNLTIEITEHRVPFEEHTTMTNEITYDYYRDDVEGIDEVTVTNIKYTCFTHDEFEYSENELTFNKTYTLRDWMDSIVESWKEKVRLLKKYRLIREKVLKEWSRSFLERYYSPGNRGFLRSMEHFDQLKNTSN